VQPASYPTKPTGPRRAYVLVLGLLMAIASGFGAAVLAAYFQPLVVSPLDIEQLLDLPLVGVLPPLRDSVPLAT
jgi:polysaccharide biosynthesis transport protein